MQQRDGPSMHIPWLTDRLKPFVENHSRAMDAAVAIPYSPIHLPGVSENRVGVSDEGIGYIHTSILLIICMVVSEKRAYGEESR